MKRVLVLVLGLFVLSSPSFAQENSKEVPPEEVVKEYIEVLYEGYLACDTRDISSYLDLESVVNRNFAMSYRLLNARRAYIKEKDYCYVETERFPLTVEITDVLWIKDDLVEVGYELIGDRDLTYPPYFYLGKNYFLLTLHDGQWKIYRRYHDDIEFHDYIQREPLFDHSFEEQVEAMKPYIDYEFRGEKMPLYDALWPAYGPKSNPLHYLGSQYENYIYDTSRALAYIDENIFSTGEGFIRIQENCANFSSQILYRGFFDDREFYLEEWHGAYGDFSDCWIYVGDLWEYMSRPRYEDEEGPRVEVHDSIYELQQGGYIEVKTYPEETWAHAMQLYDYQKMILSGNNYDGYRYYSDILLYKRFFTPRYFRFQ